MQNESVVPQPAVEMSYCGQMLYANDGVNHKWLVKFMAVKDLSALQSVSSYINILCDPSVYISRELYSTVNCYF